MASATKATFSTSAPSRRSSAAPAPGSATATCSSARAKKSLGCTSRKIRRSPKRSRKRFWPPVITSLRRPNQRATMQMPRVTAKSNSWFAEHLAAVVVFTAAAIQPLAGLAQPARTAPQGSPPPPAAVVELEQAIQSAIARAEPSVVAISRSSPPASTTIDPRNLDAFQSLRTPNADRSTPVVAAGVIIDASGLVLTQYLAVHQGDQHFVTTTDRKTYAATVRAADARSGLAVLAIDRRSNLAT